jgi:hypothetical protein
MGSGQRYRETERGKQEEEDEDMFVNFAKVLGVHCKVQGVHRCQHGSPGGVPCLARSGCISYASL